MGAQYRANLRAYRFAASGLFGRNFWALPPILVCGTESTPICRTYVLIIIHCNFIRIFLLFYYINVLTSSYTAIVTYVAFPVSLVTVLKQTKNEAKKPDYVLVLYASNPRVGV
jgi:hypothetical protein